MSFHTGARTLIEQWLQSRFADSDIRSVWVEVLSVALFTVRLPSQIVELEVSEEALLVHSGETIIKALSALDADCTMREARGQRVLLNAALQLITSRHTP